MLYSPVSGAFATGVLIAFSAFLGARARRLSAVWDSLWTCRGALSGGRGDTGRVGFRTRTFGLGVDLDLGDTRDVP